jgi:hypothetical protein
MKRALRQIPAVRWCALQYALKVRAKQHQAREAEVQAVLMALGNITISWAGIGLILNRFIEAHHQQSPTRIEKAIPRNFTGKLDYIKKVERDPRWQPERLAELRQMRLELADLNDRRINVTHGLLWRNGPGWTIHIAKEDGDSLMRKDLRHTSEDIYALSRDLGDIGGRLSRFFMPMLK